MLAMRKKIVKEKGEEPTEFEDQVAQVPRPPVPQRAPPRATPRRRHAPCCEDGLRPARTPLSMQLVRF